MIVIKTGGRTAERRANILIWPPQRSPQWVCRLQEWGPAGWRPRGPPVSTTGAALLRSHCTLHSRTFNSPSAYAGVFWITERPPRTHTHGGHTHTHTQTEPHTHLQSQTTALLHNVFFQESTTACFLFMTLWPVTTFPFFQHSTKHPGCMYPPCSNSAPRPSGRFYMVINWRVVRECVHLSLLRVKSTAWRVIH